MKLGFTGKHIGNKGNEITVKLAKETNEKEDVGNKYHPNKRHVKKINNETYMNIWQQRFCEEDFDKGRNV